MATGKLSTKRLTMGEAAWSLYQRKRKSIKAKRWQSSHPDQVNTRANRKIALIIKKGGRCLICGYDRIENYNAFDFHHRDPSKKEISISGIAYDYVVSEIEKCDLVCNRCHAEIHDALKSTSDNASAKRVVEWRRRTKARLIAYKGGACQDCGYNRPILGAFSFHHRDPAKKAFSISGLTIAFERLKLEADKCDLLCVRCHREKHNDEYILSRNKTVAKRQSLLVNSAVAEADIARAIVV